MLRSVVKRTRLTDMDIEEVSIVGRAANGEKFVVIKSDLPGDDVVDMVEKSVAYSSALAKGVDVEKGGWERMPLMPLWGLSDLVVPDLSTMKCHPVVAENLQMMLKHIGEFFVKFDDALGKVQKDAGLFPDDVVFPTEVSESLATIGKAFGIVLDIHKGEHPGLIHGKAAAPAGTDEKKDMSELRAVLQGLLSKAVQGADLRDDLTKATGLVEGYQTVCKALEGRSDRLAGQVADANRQVRALKARVFSPGALDPDDGFNASHVRKDENGDGDTDWPADLASDEEGGGAASGS